MRTSQDIGKDFEKALESVFSALSKTHAFKVHKFVDSHAAGNIVASQPSDYLIGAAEMLFFCEAKASTKQKRFQRSMLRPAQRGAIIHYSIGMMIPYYVLFLHKDEVHCLSGSEAMKGSRIRYKESLLFTCGIEVLEAHLIHFWNLRPIGTVIKRINSSGC